MSVLTKVVVYTSRLYGFIETDVLGEEDKPWACSQYRESVIRYTDVGLVWPADPGS